MKNKLLKLNISNLNTVSHEKLYLHENFVSQYNRFSHSIACENTVQLVHNTKSSFFFKFKTRLIRFHSTIFV